MYEHEDIYIYCNPNENYVSDYYSDEGWFRYDISAALISSVSLAIVACIIFSDKRLQGHPNKLIGVICMLDSYTFMQFCCRYFLCGFNWHEQTNKLFANSVQKPIYWLRCKTSHLWFDNSEDCSAYLS